MQDLGNAGGIRQGLGMMANGLGMSMSAAYDKAAAAVNARMNMASNMPIKQVEVYQVQTGYSGQGGGGGGNVPINPNQMLLPPAGGTGGGGPVGPSAGGPAGPGGGGPPNDPPGGGPTGGGGGGNDGGGSGGGKGGKGGSGGGKGGSGGQQVGGMNFSRKNLFRGGVGATALYMGGQAISEGEIGKGVGIAGGAMGGAELGMRLGGNTAQGKLIGGLVGAVSGGLLGMGAGAQADRALAQATGQDPSGKYNQEVSRYQTQMNMNQAMSNLRALQAQALENDILRMKAQEPIIARMQDRALVRQQAMNASMNNGYAMLGALASSAKMAQQSQMEAGANFRTAIQANPFGNSVVAAPSISF